MSKHGRLIWQGKVVDWKHGTFKDDKTFEVHPHFEIKMTDPETDQWVAWDNIEVQADDSSIKGITDFTKLPSPLMRSILDNCIVKLKEDEEIVRITPEGFNGNY